MSNLLNHNNLKKISKFNDTKYYDNWKSKDTAIFKDNLNMLRRLIER